MLRVPPVQSLAKAARDYGPQSGPGDSVCFLVGEVVDYLYVLQHRAQELTATWDDTALDTIREYLLQNGLHRSPYCGGAKRNPALARRSAIGVATHATTTHVRVWE